MPAKPQPGTDIRTELQRLADMVPTGPMDHGEINACLNVLGWCTTDLIRGLGFDPSIGTGRTPIFAWVAGERKIPDDVANWLRVRAALTNAMPPPPEVTFPHMGRPRKGQPLVEAERLYATLSPEEQAELMEDAD
jgi:hypothetical protein